MSNYVKTGLIKICRRCGRKGSLLIVTVPEGDDTLLVWDRTETRDIDLHGGVTFERLTDPDYGCGYDK
jgi:hypothetical protein